jgi:hypothetical protein
MPDSHRRLTWEAITLQLHRPFHLSYGVSETREAFWLRLAGDAGWGEGTIPPYYHVNQADIHLPDRPGIGVVQRNPRPPD